MNARDDVRDEVKSRLSIEDVVGRYVDLKRSGASLKGLCPFHQEKTPSFYVSPQRGTYHCFGCGRGGDVFQFVMEAEHVQFPDALRELAEEAGVRLPEREVQKPSLKGRLYEANEAALRVFREAMRSSEGRRANDYLYERGFGQDAMELFELGYAPRAGETVVRSLRERGFEDRILLAAGLAIQDDTGERMRDRFRGRLIFPIRDASGKLNGFGGRVLGDGQPKYLNSPQTETFDKSSVLFGIQRSQEPIRKSGRAVLVEGYLDAVRAHLGGFTNTVASLGTAVTAQQLTALSRLTSTVILALDPDPAGQNAAARTSLSALIEVTNRRGQGASSTPLDLRIAQLPVDSGDPDELIRDKPELWEKALNESVPAFDFYFARTMESLDRSSDSWVDEAVRQLLPVIQQFAGSPGRQSLWIQRLSAETGIDTRMLLQAMPGAPRQRKRVASNSPARDVVSRTTARALAADAAAEVEQGLMATLLQLLVVPRDAKEALKDADIRRPEHRVILDRLLTWQNYDYELLREGLPEDVQVVADELRNRKVPLPPDRALSLAVRLHLARLRQARLQAEYSRATQLLQSMAAEDQAASVSSVATLAEEKLRIDEELRELQQLVLQSGSFREHSRDN